MRLIEKDLVKFIDEKLKLNGMAQQAIKDRNPRALLIEAARACVGIREIGGNNKGPMVELMQETLGRAGREAWCMSGVQSWIAYAEQKTGLLSPVYPSEHCLTVWNNTPKNQRVKFMPLPGAICIWRHGTSTSGHTGIILGCDDKIMQLVEANTEAGIVGSEVVREGGGIYVTERSRKGSGSMKVVGWIKPW